MEEIKRTEDILNLANSFANRLSTVMLHELKTIPARLKHTSWMDVIPSYRFEMLIDPDELPSVGLTPFETVYEENSIKVRRYVTNDKITKKTPILFIYALINKSYILDLIPNFSIVEFYKKQGFDVYLIDWGVPEAEHKFLTMEDYIDGYINNSVGMIREITGSSKVNIFGWCMGGNLAVIYTALFPEKVKNLITLTLPMDAAHGGLLSLWASEELFHLTKTIELFGNMPAKLIRYSVIMMYPFNEMRKNANFYDNLHNPQYVNAYALAEKWINDNIDVPGQVMLQFIKDIFQTTKLKDSQMEIGKRKVELKKITMPLLNIAAEEDNLIPRESSGAINQLVGSKDNDFWIIPGGHVSFAYSPTSMQYWIKIAAWLTERDN